MKKVLLAIMIVMLWAGSAFCAYDNTAVGTPSTIDNERTVVSYAFIDTVAGSATGETRIIADDSSGRIIEIYWESASEDCDIWISQSVDAAVTDADTIFSASAINLGSSYTFDQSLSYLTSGGYLYVTIKNDGAIATGALGILKIVYDRGI